MPRRTKAKKIQIGNKLLNYGKNVTPMMDSNQLWNEHNYDALRLKLEREGFIFLRGIIPKNVCMKARTLMLSQALKENSLLVSNNISMDEARMVRNGNKYVDGYCVDGITGSETNERNGIDINAWEKIGPSDICRDVYNGKYLQYVWSKLFGNSCQPLIKQTFLRLMGSSGTVEHADYYYFKRDTHIFNGNDGMNAQKAALEYLTKHKLWNHYHINCKDMEQKQSFQNNSNYNHSNFNDKKLICGMCEKCYMLSDLDMDRQQRLLLNDFGVEGNWHCPKCAKLPLSIYTTWISLSKLSAPNDSILAVCPNSHTLMQWDLPQKNKQVPKDFHWKLTWVIPETIDMGDIIIFNIKTIHASSLNVSRPRSFRCSFDTRLQLVPNSNNNNNHFQTPMVSKRNKRRISYPSPHPGLKLDNNSNNGIYDGNVNDENEEKSYDVSDELYQLKI